MKVGIVGLPNAGKSTLFNALTRGGAQTGDYPFTTIEPNVAIAAGARRAAGADRRDGAQLQAGTGDDLLPRHRRPGQGRLGGGGPRQPVPRLDPRDRRDLPRRPLPRRLRRPPPRRPRRPARRHRDDRDRAGPLRLRAGRAPARTGSRKGAKSGDAEAIAERDWLEQVVEALAEGKPARSVPVPDAAAHGAAQPAGADLEADPLRRQRRRGRRRGAGGGRRRTPRRSAPAWSRSAPGSRASWPSSTRPKPRRCASPTGSRAPAWPASSAPPTTCSS